MPVVSEFSVTDWVYVVDSVLAGSVAAGSVVVLLGSVEGVVVLSEV